MYLRFILFLHTLTLGWIVYRLESLHQKVILVTELQRLVLMSIDETKAASEQLLLKVLLIASVLQSEMESLIQLFSGSGS